VQLEPVALRTNFRSQAGLVEFYNSIFPRVFPLSEDETSGAVPYSDCAPSAPALPGPAASWHCFANAEEEAGKVVELVKEAQPHGTTALLVRNRTALAQIVPALKSAGIRFRAIEIDALGEKQVVQDLFALTRALTHLGDRVAWLAVLRAPWSGFTLEELLSVVPAHAGTHTVWDELQKRSDRPHLISVLKSALENRLRGTLRDRVESAWLALGGPACLSDPTDLEDAEAYLAALEKIEEAGEVDFARLGESLERLYAQPDAGAVDTDLQIMTIHKAKGLEFATVIVPGLDRGPGRGDTPLLRWRELPDQSLLFAPIRETGTGEEPAYRYLGKLDREAEDTEAARLLYVAATRAIKRLHLMACVKVDDHGDVRAPAKRSLLGRAWAAAAEEFPETLPVSVASKDEHSLPSQTLHRLPAGFRIPQPPAPAKWTAPPEGREEEQIEFSWAGETARHVGTIVHRWLQRIAEDELKGWDAKRVEALRPRFEIELRRRGVSAPEPAAGLVVTSLKNALAAERGRWLLGPHPVALNEHRLRTGGRSMRIDRYIQAADGTKWVVDYKTSPIEGSGVEAFLDQQRERYAAQLDSYAEAVGGSKRGLYFPLQKGWREW
jgi:ATP-dependent helicase/nuclease subunit A